MTLQAYTNLGIHMHATPREAIRAFRDQKLVKGAYGRNRTATRDMYREVLKVHKCVTALYKQFA